MDSDRWRQIEELCLAAAARAPSERAAFLAAACGDDVELRREVESLLAGESAAEQVLGTARWRAPALAAGTRLGAYEIVGLIGAGGMGEVYKARDTRLDRIVALKILPPEVSSDPDRRARFAREAKSISALNHPHICTLHDVDMGDGRSSDDPGSSPPPFLVMEFLEGETLAARLTRARGARRPGGAETAPLRVEEALRIGVEIADALDHAHRHGIIHRDLKLGNVMLTKSGVKLLDFGLAKLKAGFGRPASGSQDTATDTLTEAGKVLGTVPYMAPEQIEGKETDARTDIFALGCVLYELVTGRRAFEGTSSASVMSAILKDEPEPIAERHPLTPPQLDRVVRTCLAKDPDERWQSAADVKKELLWVAEGSLPSRLVGRAGHQSAPATQPTVEGSASRLRRSRAVASGIVAGVVLTLGVLQLRGGFPFRRVPGVEALTYRFVTFSGHDWSPAVSRNVRYICFVSDRDGRSRIWVKHADGAESPLTTGSDDFPRLSPDGSEVLFTRIETPFPNVYRVPVVGGSVRLVAENALYGDWSPDARHVAFIRSVERQGRLVSALFTAKADGADVEEMANFEYALHHPRWSPDGKVIAAVTLSAARSPVAGAPSVPAGVPQQVFLVRVDGSKTWTINAPRPRRDISAVVWTDNTHVAYLQADSVVAFTGSSAQWVRQHIDSGQTDDPRVSPERATVVDAAVGHRVVFDTQSPRENLRETTVGMTANGSTEWLSRGNSADRQPVYAPDGEAVVFSSNRSGSFDLWRISRADKALTLLVSSPASEWDPAFADRGRRLLWSSDQTGHFECWVANADGGGARQLTHDGVNAENPTATPDFSWIVYASGNPKGPGLWKIRPDGSDAQLLVPGNVRTPVVSPDGRYAAFRYAPAGGKVRVAVARIADGKPAPFELAIPIIKPTEVSLGRPRWMPDGRKLLFLGQNENGVTGVFVQDFVPGRDTTATRRPFGGFDTEILTESFDISAGGRTLLIAGWEQLFSLMEAYPPSGILSRPR